MKPMPAYDAARDAGGVQIDPHPQGFQKVGAAATAGHGAVAVLGDRDAGPSHQDRRSVEMLKCLSGRRPCRTCPTRPRGRDGVGELSTCGEAVELVDGLAFGPQRHRNPPTCPGVTSPDMIARIAAQPPRRQRLVTRRCNVRGQRSGSGSPMRARTLAAALGWALEGCLHCGPAASGGGPTRVWFNGRTRASQARNGGSIPLTRSLFGSLRCSLRGDDHDVLAESRRRSRREMQGLWQGDESRLMRSSNPVRTGSGNRPRRSTSRRDRQARGREDCVTGNSRRSNEPNPWAASGTFAHDRYAVAISSRLERR